jgi:hypothetical protein
MRFLCADCGMTISVLPRNRLPYRPLELARLEKHFDAQIGWGSGLDPPARPVEAGCLQRAWQRLGQRVTRLMALLGQMLPAALTTAAQLWKALRQLLGSCENILQWLARHTSSTLLGDYNCLQPAPWPSNAITRGNDPTKRSILPEKTGV